MPQTAAPTVGADQTAEIHACEGVGAPLGRADPGRTFSFATKAFGLTGPEPGSRGRQEPRAPELASQRHPSTEPELVSHPPICQARS